MNSEIKHIIEANRLLGEFIGTLEGICAWEIPDELKSKLQAKIEELQEIKIVPPDNNEFSLSYGDKVKCSMVEDYQEYWLGTYIAKHPTMDVHIVLLRARPELNIKEYLDYFTYCEKQEF